MIDPIIEFDLSLSEKPIRHLVLGTLTIKHDARRAGIKLQATSGCIANQHKDAYTLKGRGPLPPTNAIAPQTYSVSTQRLWLPQVKGVEGSFYAISPFMVSVGNARRGDFGIHFDANAPGSAGCIVIPLQDHWNKFRAIMQEFRTLGIQSVPTIVRYT